MRRTSSLFLTAVLTLAACTGDITVDGEDAEDSAETYAVNVAAPWAKSRQNARNTAASSLGATNGDVRWRYQAMAGGPGTNVNSDPVIDASGNVYFGGREGVTSLTPAGAVRWTYKTPTGSVVYAVQLLPDGTALANASNGGLYKFDQATGAHRWGITTGTSGKAAPLVVGADGTIFMGSASTKELVAVDGAGKKKWAVKLAGLPSGPPAIRSDGLIYVTIGSPSAGTKPGVQLVDPRRARVVWTWWAPINTPAFEGGVSVTATNQALVAGYFGGKLFALDPKLPGGVAWTWQSTTPSVDLWAAPTVGSDGTIYIGEGGVLGRDGDKRVVALSATGTLKWATTLRGNINPALVLSRNGLLYAMSMVDLPSNTTELRLFALTAATGAIQWSILLPASGFWPGTSVAPALGHGRLYVGINDGYTSGATQSGSLFAVGAATLLADYGEPDPVPAIVTQAGVIKIDSVLYTPKMGFNAWMPKNTAVIIDAPPLDVPPRAGMTWVWFGSKEGWVDSYALTQL